MSNNARLQVSEPRNGIVTATFTVPLADGRTVRVRSAVALADLRYVCRQTAQRWGVSGDELVGFSFKKLAKKISKMKALKIVAKIATNPIFKSLIPPQIAMAISATEAATKAIRAAKKGSKEAKAALRTAFNAAKAGDPVAKAALNNAQRMTGTQLSPGGRGKVMRVMVMP
jgi:hypothetical protein